MLISVGMTSSAGAAPPRLGLGVSVDQDLQDLGKHLRCRNRSENNCICKGIGTVHMDDAGHQHCTPIELNYHMHLGIKGETVRYEKIL